MVERKTMREYERERERGEERAVAIAPGTTFLSAVASLSAESTFDALPHMLL